MVELNKLVQKNTDDIQTLVISVTKLSTMMENVEKRHDSDLGMIRDAVQGINSLQQKLSATLGMEKDISAVREMVLELKGDVRTARHDLNTALNVLQAVPILNEKILDVNAKLAAAIVKVEALETWRDKVSGAASATGLIIKSAWAVFGAAILAIGYAVVQYVIGSSADNGGY